MGARGLELSLFPLYQPAVRWGKSYGFPSPPLSTRPEDISIWLLVSRVSKFVTPISIPTGKIIFIAFGF